MSAQLFQPQVNLDKGEDTYEDNDYEEIDWDEFANLDMIDDLSEYEAEEAPIKVEGKKPLLEITPETKSLMEAHKDLLRWINVTVEQPTCKYPEEEYPLLSTKVGSKGRGQRLVGKGEAKRLNPPVFYTQPCGFNFQQPKVKAPQKVHPNQKVHP